MLLLYCELVEMLRNGDLGYWKRGWTNSLANVELIYNCCCVVWFTYGGGVYLLLLLWSWTCQHYYVNSSNIMLGYICSFNVKFVIWSYETVSKVLWHTRMYKMNLLCDICVILCDIHNVKVFMWYLGDLVSMWYCGWNVSLNFGMWWW